MGYSGKELTRAADKPFGFIHSLSDEIEKDAKAMLDEDVVLDKAEESTWLLEVAAKVKSLEAEIQRLRNEAKAVA
jgi:hypothetical protein